MYCLDLALRYMNTPSIINIIHISSHAIDLFTSACKGDPNLLKIIFIHNIVNCNHDGLTDLGYTVHTWTVVTNKSSHIHC